METTQKKDLNTALMRILNAILFNSTQEKCLFVCMDACNKKQLKSSSRMVEIKLNHNLYMHRVVPSKWNSMLSLDMSKLRCLYGNIEKNENNGRMSH